MVSFLPYDEAFILTNIDLMLPFNLPYAPGELQMEPET
jgi:hypothetical protein